MKLNFSITILFTILFAFQANSQSVEYTVKASFIEKIARFTEWHDLQPNHFEISVLGNSPFKGELETLAQRTKIKGKHIKINYTNNYKEIITSKIVFICSSEKSKLPEISAYLNQLNILTISDSPGFCKKGVQINFFIDHSETVKYEINPSAINSAKITIDMQLFNMGKIISKN